MEIVILGGIDIFYMAHVLRSMGPCHRVWILELSY
jgi:hypothetical protein